jgi:hypothetical protein
MTGLGGISRARCEIDSGEPDAPVPPGIGIDGADYSKPVFDD